MGKAFSSYGIHLFLFKFINYNKKKNKKGYRLLRLSGGSILEVLVGEVGDQTTDQDDAVETDTHAGAVAGARGTGGRLGLRARSRVTGLMELC